MRIVKRMNFKTFIFMILTFRRVDPIPKNIGIMLGVTFWISVSRYAAGDMDLQHTTETLIDDMDRTESLGIRSFIANNSMAIRRRLFPDLEDYEHIGYDGGSKDKINRKRLIGNTYQIYRSILHQLAIDENWNNVYSDITLPSGDMGTIKVERVDDERESKGV